MSQSPLNKLAGALDDPGLLRTLIEALPDRIYVKDNEDCSVLTSRTSRSWDREP